MSRLYCAIQNRLCCSELKFRIAMTILTLFPLMNKDIYENDIFFIDSYIYVAQLVNQCQFNTTTKDTILIYVNIFVNKLD